MAETRAPETATEKAPPQSLIACIDDAVSRGGLAHDALLELRTLRQKAVELKMGIK